MNKQSYIQLEIDGYGVYIQKQVSSNVGKFETKIKTRKLKYTI